MLRLLYPLAAALLFVLAVLVVAEWRWHAESGALASRLVLRTANAPAARFHETDLEGLPPPVQRYFRAVLRDDQPLLRHVRMHQHGWFLTRPATNGWSRFEAEQNIATRPAGFLWDAHVAIVPGLNVRVRDRFDEQGGSMLVEFAALVPMIREAGNPRVSSAALMRYLAEAAWCPTALLPSAGVRWTALDDSTARATLSASGVTASIDFTFGADSLPREVFAPARDRAVDGGYVPTPWRGRWTEYGLRNGWRVPVAGEVEWILPGGAQPYWRARVTEIEFDSPLDR